MKCRSVEIGGRDGLVSGDTHVYGAASTRHVSPCREMRKRFLSMYAVPAGLAEAFLLKEHES